MSCPLARPLNVLSVPDERVPDLPVRRASAPPLQLPEVRLLLRLHLCQGSSLCLEPNTLRGDNEPREQVSVCVHVIHWRIWTTCSVKYKTRAAAPLSRQPGHIYEVFAYVSAPLTDPLWSKTSSKETEDVRTRRRVWKSPVSCTLKRENVSFFMRRMMKARLKIDF